MNKTLRTAFLRTLPVFAGYVVLGIGFGILSLKNGYGFFWVLAMSGLIYAGSMQFVTLSLLTGGASLLTTAVTTLMVNARHLFYGISMVEKYQKIGKAKPYLIFALTDETYSLVCGDLPEGVDGPRYCFFVTLIDHIYWVGGSLLGVLVGKALPFNTTGIEFAMTALFVTVFTDQWMSTRNHAPALIGLAASVACLLVFGSANFLIPAMVLITAALLLTRKKEAV